MKTLILTGTVLTRYTVRGTGAKRRTSSALPTTYLIHLWSNTTWPRLTRSSQFNQNLPSGPYQGKESVRCQGFSFLTLSQKELQTGAGNGSLNRLIPGVNFFESGSLLDPSKSRAQTISRQQQWSRLHVPSAKINYLAEHERNTNGRTTEFDVLHGWKERFAQ